MKQRATFRYITTSYVAEMLCIHQRTAERLLRQGAIRGFRIGKGWLTKIEWVEEYIARADHARRCADLPPLMPGLDRYLGR